MKHRGLIFTIGLVLAAMSVTSAWAVNNTTNTISGVTTNGGTTFTFPSSGLSNFLFITGAGVLTNGTGILGSGVPDHYNQIIVSDSGSVWSNTSTLWVGLNGSFNQLTVSNLGAVYGADINVANSGSGNQLTVSSTGQVNGTSMIVGRFFGTASRLTVTNGGLVSVATSLYIGSDGAAATNNLVTVTGPGSRVTAGSLRVGSTGSSNQMVISQGGVVVNGLGGLGPNGAFNNTALVTDSGSVWSNTALTIGANGAFGNVLTVASSGTVYATSIEIAPNINTYGNKLIVTNGGRVFNSGSFLLNNAVGTTASNNWIIVTGAGSILTNNGSLVMGRTSPDNHMEIRQGGVVINSSGSIGANDNGASNNTVIVTDSGSVWSNTSSVIVGGLGAKSTLLIASSGTVYATGVTLGSGGNSYGNQLIITNSGRYVGGGITLGSSGVPGASNNLLRVSGMGSSVSSTGPLLVGGSSINNQMVVEDGGQVVSVGITRIGLQTTASNNLVTVTGTGSLWSNVSSIVVGSSGNGNRLVITNDGTVFATDVTVGEGTGTDNSILVHGGGHFKVSGGITLAPNGTPGASNNLLHIKGAGSTVTAGGLSVGAGAARNQVVIEDGGTLSSGAGVTRIGNQAGANSNLVLVTGQGSVWSNASIVAGNVGNGNRLVVTDGGAVYASDLTAGETTGIGNSILVQNGGLVETAYLLAGAGNSISNVGGIYQFTTPTPAITAGRVFITNGTASFRAINNAPTGPLANLSYQGNNTLRLNNATNTSVTSYTFESANITGNSSNYQKLALINNSRWQSGSLTIGTNGSVSADAGSTIALTSHFTIRNTNPIDFDLTAATVAFTGGGVHTNAITGQDLGNDGAIGFPDGFTGNFSYGKLTLASTNDRIQFVMGDGGLSNALYVTSLDLGGFAGQFASISNLVTSLLFAPDEINIYYLSSGPGNGYLDNLTYQLAASPGGGSGGFLMPAVPEPSSLALLALAGCTLLCRSRRS